MSSGFVRLVLNDTHETVLESSRHLYADGDVEALKRMIPDVLTTSGNGYMSVENEDGISYVPMGNIKYVQIITENTTAKERA